jgi:hypothetical protein
MAFQSKFVKMVLAEVESAILQAAGADDDVVFESSDAARDRFRDIVIADLAQRLSEPAKKVKAKAEVVVVPVAAPSPKKAKEEVKERKSRSPMTEEAKAVMKSKREATIAAKKGVSPVAPAPAPVVVALPVEEKKKRGPMTDEAKAVMKSKRDATIAAKKDVDVVTDRLKAMTVEDKPNLAKVDVTWRKHLKTAAKAQGKEVGKEMETALLAHLNSLTQTAFNAQKAEEHVCAFLAAPVAGAKVPADLEIVEFGGKDYYVNAETKRVYEGEGEFDEDTGLWTSWKAVGYVGMAAFADMEMPE